MEPWYCAIQRALYWNNKNKSKYFQWISLMLSRSKRDKIKAKLNAMIIYLKKVFLVCFFCFLGACMRIQPYRIDISFCTFPFFFAFEFIYEIHFCWATLNQFDFFQGHTRYVCLLRYLFTSLVFDCVSNAFHCVPTIVFAFFSLCFFYCRICLKSTLI